MAGRRHITVEDRDPQRRARLERILAASALPLSGGAVPAGVVLVATIAGASVEETAAQLEQLARHHPGARLFLITDDENIIRNLPPSGACLLQDGLNPAILIPAVSAALADTSPQLAKERPMPPPELIGESRAMRALRAELTEVARSDVTVLLLGETGTGKECATRMIHRLSVRSSHPLVAINCAAVPDALLEGELFGYERGAFTGAISAYPGKLKLADRGTLFLDEIGDLPALAQAKILRAVETQEVHRLGALKPDRFDARIVAATNVDIPRQLADGRFRLDLYYRLAVAMIKLPPLRERLEDVPLLAAHALTLRTGTGQANCGAGRQFSQAALEQLCAHDWPGNVRELFNVVEIARLRASGEIIGLEALPAAMSFRLRTVSTGWTAAIHGASTHAVQPERQRILRILAESGGNKSLAAQRLSWSRMTLYRKLTQHQIAAI
jgi:transcriptional regulator with PAS, ATPase and Fis domain